MKSSIKTLIHSINFSLWSSYSLSFYLQSQVLVIVAVDARRRSTSSKKQRLVKERGIDRVSYLPDFVLQHVLSFLETKDIVRTSVLSTRWKYVWLSIANFDLENAIPYQRIQDQERRKSLEKSFLEFVDRVTIHQEALYIRKFRLRFKKPLKTLRIKRWISALTKHNLHDLDLHLDVEKCCTLPLCLFTRQSLVILKLSMRCALKAPLATCFSNLKTLHLSSVKFTDDLSAQRLFSNCPVLHEVALVECDWEKINIVTISIPTLRNLTIKGVFSTDDATNSVVKINAVNLAILNCSLHLSVDFELGDLCSLKEASFDLSYSNEFDDEMENRMMRFFSSIYNVERMSIFSHTFECLVHVQDFVDRVQPFYNLTQLTVNDDLCTSCSGFLLEFLDKMPKLEHLDLIAGCEGDERVVTRDEIMCRRVPSCFNSSLRTFATGYFEGDLHEMLLLEYVLRNATGLESVFISCSEHSFLQEERFSEARDLLLNFPRVKFLFSRV